MNASEKVQETFKIFGLPYVNNTSDQCEMSIKKREEVEMQITRLTQKYRKMVHEYLYIPSSITLFADRPQHVWEIFEKDGSCLIVFNYDPEEGCGFLKVYTTPPSVALIRSLEKFYLMGYPHAVFLWAMDTDLSTNISINSIALATHIALPWSPKHD